MVEKNVDRQTPKLITADDKNNNMEITSNISYDQNFDLKGDCN